MKNSLHRNSIWFQLFSFQFYKTGQRVEYNLFSGRQK